MTQHPLIRFPQAAVILPPALLASVGYWAWMVSRGHPRVALDQPWDKRHKSAHRYEIADVNGRLTLTVPIVSAGASGRRWDDIGISRHGRWWEVQREALASAYGRTPYYEHYAPLIVPHMHPDAHATVGSLIRATNTEILRLLGLPDDHIAYGRASSDCSDGSDISDGSDAFQHVHCASEPSEMSEPSESSEPSERLPYWQVRASRLGFIPGLSILDLLFSLGPEAGPYLRELSRFSDR